jgi:hypothetical protein
MLNLIKKKETRLVTNDFADPYMTQYSLSFFPRLRLNIISDGDLEMHTHPWDFTSLVLYGGYKETTPKGSKTYKAGSINRFKWHQFHSLKLLKSKCVTILFTSKPKVKSIQFMVKGKIVDEFPYYLSKCKTTAQKRQLIKAYKEVR